MFTPCDSSNIKYQKGQQLKMAKRRNLKTLFYLDIKMPNIHLSQYQNFIRLKDLINRQTQLKSFAINYLAGIGESIVTFCGFDCEKRIYIWGLSQRWADVCFRTTMEHPFVRLQKTWLKRFPGFICLSNILYDFSNLTLSVWQKNLAVSQKSQFV